MFGKDRETFGESTLNFLNGNNVTLMIWRTDYAIVLEQGRTHVKNARTKTETLREIKHL